MMPEISKIRTSEQKSRKMLKEETTILDLEMAIKKEQFKKTLKRNPEFFEANMVNKGRQMASESVQKKNEKNRSILNSFRDKIGF